MELRPGLKDIHRQAALMHAHITLSLLCGLRTEEARALRRAHADPDGDPAARPPVPPHVVRHPEAGPRARRDHDRTVPPHPRPPRSGSTRAPHLVRGPGRRTARGRGRLAGHRAGAHHPPGCRAGRGQRPQDVQAHLHRGRDRGRLDPARAAHLLRQPDEPPRGQHRGDRPPRRHPPPGQPRSSTAGNCGPSSPPAPRSWTNSSQEPSPSRPPGGPPRTRTSQPGSSGT